MTPVAGIAAVLGTLACAVAVVAAFRSRLSPELSRKCVHIVMGLVCLAFPWMFDEMWPVIVLAGLALGGLAAVRWVPALAARFGNVLGGVDRPSLGEFYFPIAVATVFVLAHGRPVLYLIPILTLTFADAFGALVGGRYGLSRFRTDEGTKSAEGSMACFTLAFLSCHVPLLLLTTTPRAETLLISLVAGFLVMLLEAIAWRGQDNLIIPIGMFFLLEIYLTLTAGQLLARLLVILALVGFVLIWRNRTTLSDSAVLAGALAGYVLWSLGGWFWLAAPVLLFLVYVNLPGFPADRRPVQDLHAVTRVMAGAFFWLFLALGKNDDRFLTPFVLTMAAHTGNIVAARLVEVRPEWPRRRVVLTAVALPAVVFGLLAAAGIALGLLPVAILAVLPLCVALSVAIFLRAWPTVHTRENRFRVWMAETLTAGMASLPGLLIITR